MKKVSLLAGILFLLASCSYLPLAGSLSPVGVTLIDHRNFIELRPTSGTIAPVGLVFIPGGLVDPWAYVEAMSRVSQAGYVVVIAKVPANLAIINANQALGLKGSVSGPSRWAIAGHSLGGTVASMAIDADRSAFVGLILEASYPADTNNLSTWTAPVLSLRGEFDGLSTQAKVDAAKHLLSASTNYQIISGGCHAYFGSYGAQDGDGTPTITRDNQQTTAAAAIVAFLGAL